MENEERINENEAVRLNSYFKNRGIDPAYYLSFQLPQYLKDELPADKNAPILDVGCGFGQMLMRLKDAGYSKIKGIDIGNESVDFCRKSGLDVVQIQSIKEFSELSQQRFQLILMSHVLEHIPKDEVIENLMAIRGMLLPGGSFIVMVPNAQSATGVYWMYEDYTHYQLFTAGSLIYVLKSAGFQSIEFLDPKCLKGLSVFQRVKRRIFLRLYELKTNFWNRATASSFHKPSPRIFSFELKAKATN